MSYLVLSPAGIAIGIAALAAGLFALQRLRIRHRRVTVVTTLFWREAIEEARARTLFGRFRNLPAYLLFLLIASLLWFGFAGPRPADRGDADRLILIDASAGMARGDRFAATLDLVRERVPDLPRDGRRVVLCGAIPRTVLAPGEEAILLDERLAGATAEPSPATVETTLLDLARTARAPTEVLIFGDAPVSEVTLAGLPETMTVARVAPDVGPDAAARGITDLGVTSAASGAWNRVDVFVGVAGGAPVEVRLGDAVLDATAERRAVERGARLVFRDVPARGERFSARIAGEAEFAAIRLPERPLIRVALSESLAAALGPVLAADPAVRLTTENPDVAIRRSGEAGDDSVPALVFVPTAEQEPAFLLHHDEAEASREVVLTALGRLGLEQVDAMELAASAGRPVSVGASPAEVRSISAWAALLTAEYNFVQSRSFPLFVAMGVRWLAGATEFPAFVAAGAPVAGDVIARTAPDGTRYDPAGADFVPPRVGTFTAAGAPPLDAALTGAGTPAPAALPDAGPDGAGGGDALVTLLLLAALGLLVGEWLLFRRGRLP